MIEYNNVLGSSGLVLSAAFFERIADAYRLADWLNEKADLARRHGLDFYYHNHFHEFQELDGEAVMDVLLAQTNPATVRMETDVCWVSRAGLDPVEYLRRHGARTGALHVKDLARHARPVNLLAARPGHLTPDRVFSAAAPDDFVPVGSGSLDIAAVLAEALRLPSLRHLVIEQDESRDEIADAASGLRHVQGLLASAA
jgi:sugar phosphate isomerase/epimerase